MCYDGFGFEMSFTAHIDHKIIEDSSDPDDFTVLYGTSCGIVDVTSGFYLPGTGGAFTQYISMSYDLGGEKKYEKYKGKEIMYEEILSYVLWGDNSTLFLCNQYDSRLCCNNVKVGPARWVYIYSDWYSFDDANASDSDLPPEYTIPSWGNRSSGTLDVGGNKFEIKFSLDNNPDPSVRFATPESYVYRIELNSRSATLVGTVPANPESWIDEVNGIVCDDISSYTSGVFKCQV